MVSSNYKLFRLIFILIIACSIFIARCGDDKGTGAGISVNRKGELEIIFSSDEKIRGADFLSKATFGFGVPQRAADKVWVENGVLSLQWNEKSIIYTMNIFCCPIEENEFHSTRQAVIIRLHGENTDVEYKDAHAGFLILTNGKRTGFEFQEGVVQIKDGDRVFNLVAIEIPAGCHVDKKKDLFVFSGNMPPGTTGYMVFKIPVRVDSDFDTMSRLVNLDYEDCLNMFKKAFKTTGGQLWMEKGAVFYQKTGQ
jgi:hypothetical protein